MELKQLNMVATEKPNVNAPGRVEIPIQRFEKNPNKNNEILLKLTWREPESFGSKIKSYDVNI